MALLDQRAALSGRYVYRDLETDNSPVPHGYAKPLKSSDPRIGPADVYADALGAEEQSIAARMWL